MRLALKQKTAFCRVKISTAALAICLVPAFAHCASAEGNNWYIGASIPLMFIDDTETTSVGSISAGGTTTEYSANAVTEYATGFRVAGVLGYWINPSLRIEGELFFAKAKVDKLTYSGIVVNSNPLNLPATSTPVSGSADQLVSW